MGCEEPAPQKPNIILIMPDDQGYGDLAVHGHPLLQTPNLDALHNESLRLTDFHVDPTCSPTRAALLTGRYSTRTGVWHTIMGRSILDPDEKTLAEYLKGAGYQTGIFGKWHLGENYPSRPQDQGFETVLIHGGGGVGQTPDFFGNDYFDDTYRRGEEWVQTNGYSADVWFNEAIGFINDHKEVPFFVYLPSNTAHGPFLVDSSYSNPYRAQSVSDQMANFYGMITNLDDNMGRLRAALEQAGVAENTILIFMTDNGSAFGEMDEEEEGMFKGYNAGMRGRKGSVYEGGHRVPFFLHWPAGGFNQPRDIGDLTAHIDVLPTLFDLIGIPIPENIDGRSLKPLFQGETWDERILFVHSQRIENPRKGKSISVMHSDYRLVNNEELYAIKEDPGQERNIADAYPDLVNQLSESYDAWWSSLEEVFDEYVYIGVGYDEEPVTQLTAHDWHTNNGPVPWHQNHIRDGLVANGFWAIDVARSGTYRLELRRWPAEEAGPIEAIEAKVQAGEITETMRLDPDQEVAVIEMDLPAGKYPLQSWLTLQNGDVRGGYYASLELIE